MNGLSTRVSQELVQFLAGLGAQLFLSDVTKEALQKTEEKLAKQNRKAHYIIADNRDPYQVEDAVNRAFKTLKTLDCAINNFPLHSIPTNIIDCSVDFLVRTCMSSLSGVFLLMKYELSLMLGLQKPGTIINIFSTNRLIDFENSHATTAYLHAIKGLTLSTSNSYAGNGIKIKSFFVQYDEKDIHSKSTSSKILISDISGDLTNLTGESILDVITNTLFRI